MKKIITIITALALALVFVGCASAPSASSEMQNARKKAPGTALVGMATAQDAAGAEKAAQDQLVRAMNSMVGIMAQDAVADGKITSATATNLAQWTATALSKVDLSSAVNQGSGKGNGNVYWAVLYMEKTNVVNGLSRAVTDAKQLVPEAAAFSIDPYIEATYKTACGWDWSN